MRPVYMRLAAFGPFIKEETVDFDQLSSQGLFLITGPTGSGKTTIFDAITFALYGQASGDHRDQRTLRNDRAADDQETYVELVFSLKQDQYTIYRSPSYQKQGRKTPVPMQVRLTMPDGRLITGIKEVNQTIQSLLGLDVQQFKQIAMIAQGEFTKLLFASSDDKEKIFRKIFDTFHYEQFEADLKERYQSVKREVEDAQLQLSTYTSSIDHPFEGSYDDYLASLNEAINELEAHYQQTNDIYNKHQEEVNALRLSILNEEKTNASVASYQQLQVQLGDVQKNQPTIEALEKKLEQVKKAKEIAPYENQVWQYDRQLKDNRKDKEKMETDYTAFLQQFSAIETNYQSLANKREEKEKLVVLINEQKAQLLDVQKLAKLQRDYQNQSNDLALITSQEENYTKNHEKCLQDIETIQKAMEEAKVTINKKEENRLLIENLNKRIRTYNQVVSMRQELNQNQLIHERNSLIYQKLDQDYLQHENLYQQHTSLFYSMQAGILASNLKEGEPCPVCGSTHHPSLAKRLQYDLSQDSLDEEFNQLSRLKAKRDSSYQSLRELHLKIENIQQNIDSYIEMQHLGDVKADDLNNEMTELSSQRNEIKNAEKQYSKYQLLLGRTQSVDNALVKDIETLGKQKEALIQSLSSLEGSMKQLNAIENSQALKQQYQANLLKLNELEQAINQVERQYQSMNQQKHAYIGKIDQSTKIIETLEMALKKANDQWMEKLKDFNTYEDYQEYKELIPTLEKQQQQVEQHYRSLERINGQIETIKNELTRFTIEDLSPMQDKLKELSTKTLEMQAAMQEEHTHLHQYQRVYKQVKTTYERIADKQADYQLYYELYQVTSGNNPQKLSFERYILSAYFEQIISLANIRFMEMTNNRYRMIRKEDKSTRQTGLDLQVQDYQSGTIRDITTLSGGESFKAALALALGLSDMIQNFAGGIELNTLFIDEGFGSLDQESLDQAIQVLISLNQEDKMIGIISHVTELKQRIDNQLIIEKDENGQSYIQHN